MRATKSKSSTPEVVFRKGKPVAVILTIKKYEDLLRRLEDAEDLKQLGLMRRKSVKFRRLEDFLAEYTPDV